VALTLALNSGSLAKAGSTFAGWNTAADGSGTTYATGATYTTDAALVLYAKWTLLPTYIVTYAANGATGGSAPGSQIKTQGVNLTLALNTGGLVKTGSVFAGWNTAANGSGTAYAVGSVYAADAAVTLYAQWTLLPTYAVTYNANGASSGTIPAAQTKTQGIDLILALNSGSLAKTGATFAGWNTAADGSGTGYAVGASYAVDAAVTLYASWSALPTYAVTYNANGATSGTAPGAQSKIQGVNLTLAANTGSLAKSGSSFAGWNTAANGSGTGYAAGAVYAADAAVVLYATWTVLPTYAVTYSANGATSGTPPASQTKTQGVNLTLATNSGGLAKTGSTFAGWNTAADGSGTGYAAGATYNADAAVTLYATWTALPTYVVTYNANGATSGTAPGTQNKTQGVNLTLALNSGSLAKTGATFAGWNTAANGTGTAYAAGAVYATDAALTLYAAWTVLPTYAVTYNANGATGGTAPGAQSKIQGVTLTLASNSGSLIKNGSTFAGWNTAANGSGTSYAVGATYSVDAALTLYAAWTTLPTYAVTYNANGATSGAAPPAQTKTQGVTLTLAGNTGSLAKVGSVFAGWNTATNGSGTAYAAGAAYTGNAALTLYAAWTVLPTYAVTYDANGATSGTAPTAQSKTQGVDLALAVNSGGLAKAGSTFAGWNTASDGSGTGYAAGGTYAADAAVTLYAAWTVLPTYAVTYVGNGSDGGVVPNDVNAYLTGATVLVQGNTGGLYRDGYAFAGWNTQADGSGSAYVADNSFLMATADVILYAAWSVLPTYGVTYAGNGNDAGSVPVDGASYLTGADVIVLGNSGALTRSGYTFAGWNTAADGSSTSRAPGAVFPMGTSAVVLYAQWTLVGVPPLTPSVVVPGTSGGGCGAGGLGGLIILGLTCMALRRRQRR
jgi:uncharacterized repeat protein (TIGR02543 family)